MMKKEIFTRYLMASLLASAFAGLIAFTCWVLNQSPLPPDGGGWKLLLLPPVLSWLVVFALVVIHDKTRARKFTLRIETEQEEKDSNNVQG